MIKGLGSEVDLALQQALNGSLRKHQAIAENLANVDTPGYKRREVEFAGALKAALAAGEAGAPELYRTNARHLSAAGTGFLDQVRPLEYRVQETIGRADGNNVDIDAEMAGLAENTLLYNSLNQVLGRRLAMLRFVVSEGRR